AQLIIGSTDGVVFSNDYGYYDYSKKQKVTDESLYDLASCTKIFSTTLSVMRLIDEQKIALTDEISKLLPETDTMKFAGVTVRELLYHCSGFLPTIPVATSLVKSKNENIPLTSRYKSVKNPYCFDKRVYVCKEIAYDTTFIHFTPKANDIKISSKLYLDKSYGKKIDSMVIASYNPLRRGYYKYSDLNFYVLQRIVERVSGKSIDSYAASIYDKMNIKNIGYTPLLWSDKSKVIPTEYDCLFRRDTMRGIVHDELACVLGGVAGHAGLFSNANALAEICTMFLNGGIASNNERIVSEDVLSQFVAAKKFSSGAIRGLGFDKLSPLSTPYNEESFGHTGYTGTYFWVDPVKKYYVILLTNRVNPSRANKRLSSDFRG
ncbi:MAG: serine hydrolase domain-containing protein, partial [Rikenellaceae bacterium]